MKIKILTSAILALSVLISQPAHPLRAEDDLSSLFTQRTERGVIISEYLYSVHDLSPEWPKILFTGLSYSAISAVPGDTIAVGIREQDGRLHTYSTAYTDYRDFLNDRISLDVFLRRMRKR